MLQEISRHVDQTVVSLITDEAPTKLVVRVEAAGFPDVSRLVSQLADGWAAQAHRVRVERVRDTATGFESRRRATRVAPDEATSSAEAIEAPAADQSRLP